MEISLIMQSLANGIISGFIFVLIALGLNLVFGVVNILNFAHGVLVMLGAFAMWVLTFRYHLNFILAFLLSMFLVAIIGIMIERGLFRPLRGTFWAPVVICVGVMLIAEAGAILAFGVTPKAVPTPSILQRVVHGFGISLSLARLTTLIISLVLTFAFYILIVRTKLGKSMQAVAQDPDGARLQGISIDFVSSMAMGMGSAIAAAAGCLLGMLTQVDASMGMQPLLWALVVVVVGGLGSLPGAVLGGLIIGMIQGFVSTYFSSAMATIAVFVVLIIMLVAKPSGLFGRG
jgi:branched-chain amino acid transport system permease protein